MKTLRRAIKSDLFLIVTIQSVLLCAAFLRISRNMARIRHTMFCMKVLYQYSDASFLHLH